MKKRRPSPRRSAAAKQGWATRRAKAKARSAAAVKGWATRRKKKKSKPPRGAAPIKEVPSGTEEWEVTISYREKGAGRLDVTVRVVAPVGTTAEQISAAVTRAIHGGTVSHYKITWVDWQRIGRTGNTINEGHGTAANLHVMRAPLLAGRWRVAKVAP